MSRRAVVDNVTPAEVRAARRAVLAVFFINGVAIATWVSHLPLIKETFQLGADGLGLVLFAGAVGAVTSLVMAGRLVSRFGSRRITAVTTIGLCAVLPLLILVPNLALLAAVLVLFGMCQGAMDVAMNAQAVAVEARHGRPLMSSFHALFSLGGLIGAAVASALLSVGMSATAHVVGAALVLIVASAVALRALLPAGVDRVTGEPTLVSPTGPLIGLGILALFALLSEGAIADWSAVYLRIGLGTDAGFAAGGYAAFSLTMTIGRLVGDRLRARIDSVSLLRLSGAMSALGLGIALVVGQPIVALIGFACFGFGLANVVPVLFSAAGSTPGVSAGVGIAAVATAGYCGFLVGPPLIGFVAQATTVPAGLGVIVLFTVLIAIMAGSVGRVVQPAFTNE